MSDRIIVSRAHRDALYAELLTTLSELADLEACSAGTEAREIAKCERIGRRLSEAFRLIQDGGLGWGYPEVDEAVELTLPPAELRRIIERRRRLLAVHQETNHADRIEAELEWRQAEEARAACTAVLEQIEELAPPCR
ncbi:MAG TPA: hypothetical protein VFJ76_06810 [Solirubrobacterales bacterium]|nr:hypothetical protein [Solirubrobacterales bacterium]